MSSPARASGLAALPLPAWVGRATWIPESAARSGSAGASGPTPMLKQLPMLVLFVLAVLTSFAVPTIGVTAPRALLVSCAILVVSTVLAVVVTLRRDLARFAVVVPALDFLAVGLLRIGTGESASVFGSLVILPVVWFSLNPSRWNVLVAFVGTYVSLGLPLLLRLGGQNANELWRGFFSALAFGVAALVVNELSRRTRFSLEDRARPGAGERGGADPRVHRAAGAPAEDDRAARRVPGRGRLPAVQGRGRRLLRLVPGEGGPGVHPRRRDGEGRGGGDHRGHRARGPCAAPRTCRIRSPPSSAPPTASPRR